MPGRDYPPAFRGLPGCPRSASRRSSAGCSGHASCSKIKRKPLCQRGPIDRVLSQLIGDRLTDPKLSQCMEEITRQLFVGCQAALGLRAAEALLDAQGTRDGLREEENQSAREGGWIGS